ncbi:MAG: DUF4034 domain-containing protein [Acidobacteria bacterium]|nr:DUF4034 domain-containing protein [Acidobacteriota bacterium]
MKNVGFKNRFIFLPLFGLLIFSSSANFTSYSFQNESVKDDVSIDYLGKSGPATRKINGVEYSLVPQQAEWAQMLYLDKAYDAVEKGILELLTRDPERNSFILYHRYNALSTIPDGRYVGMMKDVLNEWCRRNPDSHIPWLVRGEFYTELAWDIRGGGYASTVTEEKWGGFYQNLEWAKKDLEHSYKLNPEDPNSSCYLIQVALGLGQGFREIEKHYSNAVRVCPAHYGAHWRKFVFLLPQWSGSVEEMNTFADKCQALSDKYPYLGLVRAFAYENMMWWRDQSGYTGKVERYLDGDVWSTIDAIFKRILEQYPDDLLTRFNYARIAYTFDKPGIALDQFKIIGNRWMINSRWVSLNNYNKARENVYRTPEAGPPRNLPRGDQVAADPAQDGNSSGGAAADRPPAKGQSAYPDVRARQRHADELARQGKNAEALAEYLWCFDEGMRKAPEYSAVRLSFLLGSIARLGKQYPPALDQLRERRDAARASLDTNPLNLSAQADFAAINRELGENEANLAFYNQLPLSGPSRTSFGLRIWDTLIEARRYRDAVEVKPCESFMKELVNLLDLMRRSPGLPVIRQIVTRGGKELEALAGAGNLDQARALLKLLKEMDPSEETLGELRQHLERAGHEELLQDNNREKPIEDTPIITTST